MLERQEEEDLKKLDSDNKINENLLNNLNKGWFSNRSENLLGSEEIFMNIKKEIEVIKKRNEDFHLKKESTKTMNNNDNINIFESDLHNKNKIIFEEEKNNKLNTENNNEIQEFNLNDRNDGKIIFEYSAVNYLAKEKKQFEFNKNWKNFDKNFPLLYEIRDTKQGYEYIELNKMVLRLVKEIDYDEYGLELNLKVNLLFTSQMR